MSFYFKFVVLVLTYTLASGFKNIKGTSSNLRGGLLKRWVSDANVAAYFHAKHSTIQSPCIILVSPYSDANVGSISRLMLNFGMHELRVVHPECNILSDTATTLAVGSVEILRNAKIYESLKECVADLDIVVATTPRKISVLNQINLTPREAAVEMITPNNVHKAGILFGRERNGLTTEEIGFANRRVFIPAFEHYKELNLAQSVNILAYECFNQRLQVQSSVCGEDINGGDGASNEEDRPIVSSEMDMFIQRILRSIGESRMKAGSSSGSGSVISNRMGKDECDVNMGVSGWTKTKETQLAAVFHRVSP